ncbi:hypothetical protein KJ953_04485 [Patescibacteria group bacterium]|nr:hypothetical protein [Patescibacteria group bacterium]MBU1256143.1 hypothetical protein [Patescibacteria group bacterium]MBU1457250.1 hypothetical protein [Patescibacteria group bacterium]
MNKQNLKTFSSSFIGGIGWAFGASIGFALLITILSYVLNLLGGLPLAKNALNYLQTVK